MMNDFSEYFMMNEFSVNTYKKYKSRNGDSGIVTLIYKPVFSKYTNTESSQKVLILNKTIFQKSLDNCRNSLIMLYVR